MAEPAAVADTRSVEVLLLEAPAGSGVDRWADDLESGLASIEAGTLLRRHRRHPLTRFFPWPALFGERIEEPDIVHTGTWLEPAVHEIATRIVTVHLVVHDDPHYGRVRGMARRVWHHRLREREERAIRRAAAVVAVSGHVADRVHALFGVESHVIQNGVDLAAFRPSGEARSGSARPRVITVGAASKRKGFDLFMEVARRLSGEAEFLHIGPIGNRIARRASSAGIAVIGALPRSEVADQLRRSDIFFWPSRCEGFGLSLLEALATGLPVCASSIAPTRELMGGGTEAGAILCRVGDGESHAKGLRELIALSHEARKEIGRSNRRRAEAIGSRERMAREYAELYREQV
ncbi:MAG: hypothetical protein CME06_04140 [Gemmatimonadetes bacterium]|nr:hypothetical protein [Gemmatimonadota bacterium]